MLAKGASSHNKYIKKLETVTSDDLISTGDWANKKVFGELFDLAYFKQLIQEPIVNVSNAAPK